MSGLAVFAYGSLAHPASAAETLGRPVELAGVARLEGWARRWTLARDNRTAEKTFALADDGSLPDFCVGLSLEPEPGAAAPNGALIEVTEAELERLDLREMRYQRIDATEAIRIEPGVRSRFETVIAYRARPEYHHPSPPPGAILIASYLATVEAAFAALGPGQLELFRATTGPPPVEVVEATLVRDRIPAGNPRRW